MRGFVMISVDSLGDVIAVRSFGYVMSCESSQWGEGVYVRVDRWIDNAEMIGS